MVKSMLDETSAALSRFTQNYLVWWQQQRGDYPYSEALYGVPSPCIVRTEQERVYWQPQIMEDHIDLGGISRALDIQLHPDFLSFFTHQFAGDMRALDGLLRMDLVQIWNEEDGLRLQENQIGHLLTQRRLKLSPTLFLATTEDALRVVSLCNLTGKVLLEQLGRKQRETLALSLKEFLSRLQPVVS